MPLSCKTGGNSWDTAGHLTCSKVWTALERVNLLPITWECRGAAGAPLLVGAGSSAWAGGTPQRAWETGRRACLTTSTTPNVSHGQCQFSCSSPWLQPLHDSFPGAASVLRGLSTGHSHAVPPEERIWDFSRPTAVLGCFPNFVIG